ncbi:Uncharacterised protein [Mycobacteroides abscessus subsp. massiliense]|uniref:hypothetical protein n=1 Tax=Mycobacteroides abscessus TaxID=36809 RepID=UPI0009CF87DB|nr:hypothetical protein [Mycobacteroides abscessus]SKY29882.1 Uncharacterised protein [Mycobacteroides abscessus subsp. massiliense]SKY71456.1 Uncharacterised protein [Mycobacteroides abscessus subsp. massiliense]
MAEKLLAGTPRWAPPIFTEESALKAVDEMFAAANSIPEGAPVGAIARRPDGKNIALRVSDGERPYWVYLYGKHWDTADSWPQIRPDQWPDQSGLDWFPPGEEPLVPRPDPTDHPSREELQEYFHKDLAEHCQADDPDEYHEGDKPRLERLMREPSVFDADPHGTVNLDGTLPTFTPDPTARQEPATTHSVSPESTNCVPKPLGDPS